jgi:Flp pilus assembly protein TadG
MLRRFRTSESDDGASAVEFALVVPILIMIVFGIIEFGVVFAQTLALSNAARQGARYAAVPNYDDITNAATTSCSGILQQVRGAASTIGLNPNNVTVSVSVTGTGGSPCVWSATTSSWTTGDGTVAPCIGSSAGADVTVLTKFNGRLMIPLVVSNPTFGLTGKGVYQCEYTN